MSHRFIALMLMGLCAGCAHTPAESNSSPAPFSMDEFHANYSAQCDAEVADIDLDEVPFAIEQEWLVIDGRSLPASCLQVAAFWQKHHIRRTYKPYYWNMISRVRVILIERIVKDYLLESEAQRASVSVSEDDVDVRYMYNINAFLDPYDDTQAREDLEELLLQELHNSNESPFYIEHFDRTLVHWRNQARRQLSHEALYGLKTFTDEDVDRHYAAHIEDYTESDKPILEIIYLEYKKGETVEDTMKQAQELHRTLLEHPADFTQLATQHSDPLTATRQTKNPLPEQTYSNFVQNLKPNTISEPVAIAPWGVYIFKHKGVIVGQPIPLDDNLRARIHYTMIQAQFESRSEAVLTDLQARYAVKEDLSKIEITITEDDDYGRPESSK